MHIANGNPQPVLGDATNLQEAGGAVGYVTSSLLLDLMQTPYVVVPLLALLAVFGVLIITATPVYQIPVRLAALRDKALGRTPAAEAEADEPTKPVRTRRRSMLDDEIDPEMGDPAYDSPVLSDRELQEAPQEEATSSRRRTTASTCSPTRSTRRLLADAPTEVTPAVATLQRAARTTPARSSRRRTRRCPPGSSSSRCPATSPTRCPTTPRSSPARRTRRAPRPATRSSSG